MDNYDNNYCCDEYDNPDNDSYFYDDSYFYECEYNYKSTIPLWQRPIYKLHELVERKCSRYAGLTWTKKIKPTPFQKKQFEILSTIEFKILRPMTVWCKEYSLKREREKFERTK